MLRFFVPVTGGGLKFVQTGMLVASNGFIRNYKDTQDCHEGFTCACLFHTIPFVILAPYCVVIKTEPALQVSCEILFIRKEDQRRELMGKDERDKTRSVLLEGF